MQTVESSHRDRRLLPQVATFEVLSHGTTRSRAGILTLGTRSIQTPVVWLGHTLKSRVRFISDGDLEPLPILMSFAEFRDNGTALDRSRRHGLHRALEHAGPILLDSGGYAFQKRRSIDLCPNDLTSFYEHSGTDIGVALDHPLSPAASRRTFALIASPYAMMRNCRKIALGSTTTDAKTGDSNAGFVTAFNRLVDAMGLQKVPPIVAPFLDLGWNKTQLTRWGRENIGDDFVAMTHSCWNREPCGTCPACVAREVALRDSGPPVK
jgi:hypothetical protein